MLVRVHPTSVIARLEATAANEKVHAAISGTTICRQGNSEVADGPVTRPSGALSAPDGRVLANSVVKLLPDALGCLLDGLVHVLGIGVELLGDVLLGLQLRLVHGVFDGALADNEEGGLTGVDDVPELLHVRA